MAGGGRGEINAPNREKKVKAARDRSGVQERDGEGVAAGTWRSATIKTKRG